MTKRRQKRCDQIVPVPPVENVSLEPCVAFGTNKYFTNKSGLTEVQEVIFYSALHSH